MVAHGGDKVCGKKSQLGCRPSPRHVHQVTSSTKRFSTRFQTLSLHSSRKIPGGNGFYHLDFAEDRLRAKVSGGCKGIS